MKIVRKKEDAELFRDNKGQDLEKIIINEPSILFVLSDRRHRPLIQIFQGV